MNLLNIDVQTPVLDFQREDDQRDGEVPELDQLPECQIPSTGANQQQELHEPVTGLHHRHKQEDKAERVEEAEQELHHTVEQVPVGIEGVVTVVRQNELMHKGVFLHKQYAG